MFYIFNLCKIFKTFSKYKICIEQNYQKVRNFQNFHSPIYKKFKIGQKKLKIVQNL